MIKHLTIILVFLMTFSSNSAAQDFDKGNNAGDYGTAIKEWTPLAEQGYADVQYNLSFLYDHGYGTHQDYKKAIKRGRLAAIQGHAKAQHFLGVMYESGTGVQQSNVVAHTWFIIAFANGNARSAAGRGETSNLMVPTEILKAQEMASNCIKTYYEDCDITINQEIDQMPEICKNIAGMGSGIARLQQAGEDVDQQVAEAVLQILNDGADGKVNKSLASKMVASISLGAAGVGTPDEIGYFIYDNCMKTDWFKDD